MVQTFSVASLLSACHCVACAARSSSAIAASTLVLKSGSSTWERSQPPFWVNSGAMTVDAFGQSAPQPP